MNLTEDTSQKNSQGKKKKKVSKRACITIIEKVDGSKPERILLPCKNHKTGTTAQPVDLKEDRTKPKEVQMRITEVNIGTEVLLG